MISRIVNYPLSSPLVDVSLATEITEGQVSKVLIDLTSRIALLPNSVDYFKANNLLPEALSKAGLKETTTYSVIQQTAYTQSGNYHLYQIQLTIPAS